MHSLRSVRNVAATIALSLSLGAALSACKKETLGASGEEAMTPVPPPAGLAAELFVPKPGELWQHTRAMVGGGMKLLPSEYPMLVAMLLGLPAGVAEQIDANVPTVGAITSDGETEMPVVAIHLRDASKALAAMTTAPDARFSAKVDAPSKVTILEPKPGQTALTASLGILGNYLLVAYAPDALLRVGPYAVRTVPTHPMPSEDVALIANHQGLAGPLKARLMGWWDASKKALDASDQTMRQQHGGSAPTFGDPSAAIGKADATFQGLFAIMGDLAEGRITLKVDDAGAHARFGLKPQSPNGTAAAELGAMLVGPAEPILDLPDDVTLALLSRDSAEVRAKAAADQIDGVNQLLAGKLADADKKMVSDLFESWSKGRGDWLLAGGSIADGHRVAYVETAVADASVLDRGLTSLLALPKVPAFADPLKQWVGELKISAPATTDGASVVSIERKTPAMKLEGKDRKKETQSMEIGWQVDKDVATYVASEHARDALAALAKAKSGASLRSDPEITKMVQSLGADAAFTLLILPVRTMAAMAGKGGPGIPSAPVVVSFGRTSGDGWFRFDASSTAVREIARARGMD